MSPHRTTLLIAPSIIVLGIASCSQPHATPMTSGGRNAASLIVDLSHQSPQVRRHALLKLSNIGDADPLVPPALLKALNDRDPLVRREALFAINKLSHPSADILHQLLFMAEKDPDPSLRELARRALVKQQGR